MAITWNALNKKLAKLARDYPERAGQIKQRAAEAALRELVFRTPVDTGLARGSWRVTQSRPSRARPRKDRSGATTMSNGLRVIRGVKGVRDVYITNVSDHLALINSGAIKITKATPFAAAGFVENGLRAAQISVGKDSLFKTRRF